MKNRYPKPCGVCQGWVPAGEGILQGSHDSGWVVTHADACPKGSVRHGHAQALAHRVMSVLRRKDSTADETMQALSNLGALLRTGWTNREACERIILKAHAFADLDRIEVEMLLDGCLTQEGMHC